MHLYVSLETGSDGSVNVDASDGEERDTQRTVSEQSAQCLLALKSFWEYQAFMRSHRMYSLLHRDPLVSPCLSETTWQSGHYKMRATTKNACHARKLKSKQLTPRAMLNHFGKSVSKRCLRSSRICQTLESA